MASYAQGLLIFRETDKTIGWAVLLVFGFTGYVMTWISDKWASRLMIVIWVFVFGDIAIKGFLRLYFGIRPNPAEIFNAVLHTTTNESLEFLGSQWRLVLSVLLLFCTAIALGVWCEIHLSAQQKTKKTPPNRSVKVVSLVCLLLFVATFFNPVMRRESAVFFWPHVYDAYTSEIKKLAAFNQAATISKQQLSSAHYTGERAHTVVLVIGESLTRANMSLYGYERQTTPSLDKMRESLYVFDDVISPSYLTAFSIIKMLSPATINEPDNWKNNPNIVQLAKAVGYKTFWLSNQMALDGWVTLVSTHTDEAVFTNVGDMIGESAFDGALLPHIDKAFNDPAPLKLVVVHLLGNHFYYSLRYPANYKLYDNVDDIVTKKMAAKGRASWVIATRNQYDNSVAYNDSIIGALITSLESASPTTTATLVYASDHGQEVGHNRDFTRHSAVDKTGLEIPMIMWTNTRFAISKDVLEKRPYQTDRLDATMLGLLKISTPYYRADDDVLSMAFSVKTRLMEGAHYYVD